MRRDDAEKRSPLGVRLADELDVAEPQIAEAAVDQLRRGARGGAAEVAAVDERDAEAQARSLARDRRHRDPAADHEQVEAARVPARRARLAARLQASQRVRPGPAATRVGDLDPRVRGASRAGRASRP